MNTFKRFCASALLMASTAAAGEAPEPPRVIYLLDSTGSMANKLGQETKLDVSKRVFGGFMDETVENARMGLIVFGNRKQSCDDVPMGVPVSAGSKARISEEVKKMTPLGTTPMAKAILVAGDYLIKNKMNATVVLITDGEEQCDGDPFAAAAELRKSGLDIILHVVGFSASDRVRKQLEKLAQTGGGAFYDARGENELINALRDASGRQAKYLKLFSSSEQPQYSKALHAIRDGETLEVQFRPSGSSAGFGPHGIKLQIGSNEVELQKSKEGWQALLVSSSGNRVVPWPRGLELRENQWNRFRIAKNGDSCDVLLNDIFLLTLKDSAEMPPVKTGVQGFAVDVGAISVQFQPY